MIVPAYNCSSQCAKLPQQVVCASRHSVACFTDTKKELQAVYVRSLHQCCATVCNSHSDSTVVSSKGMPVTPQNGATLEGAGAAAAVPAAISGRLAAAESRRDRLWTDRSFLQSTYASNTCISCMAAWRQNFDRFED